jgi:hypothetical protein
VPGALGDAANIDASLWWCSVAVDCDAMVVGSRGIADDQFGRLVSSPPSFYLFWLRMMSK